jgi:hypothetical protein
MDLETIKKLVEFDTPTVANGLALIGGRDLTVGYTGPDIRALMPELGPRVGIAVTARMDTTTAGQDDTSHPKVFYDWLRHIVEISGAGSGGAAGGAPPVPVFAIVEAVGMKPRYTVSIGDGMGTQLAMAGAVGYLTNGSIRDLAGVRAVPLPCWGAGVSPMHGTIRWLDVNVPVVIDGMTVRPGDIIHADENGALVIPPAVADQVYERAAAVRDKEAALFTRLRQPGMTITRFLEGLGR